MAILESVFINERVLKYTLAMNKAEINGRIETNLKTSVPGLTIIITPIKTYHNCCNSMNAKSFS